MVNAPGKRILDFGESVVPAEAGTSNLAGNVPGPPQPSGIRLGGRMRWPTPIFLAAMQGKASLCYNNQAMGTRGFDRSVSWQIASRGAIALVKQVANA